MRNLFLFLAVLATSIAAWAQSDARPEILVLGTYHMANRGRDIFNLQADDVLSPKRQQEMAQVIEALKKFHPTKIAIEADIESQVAGQKYSDYLAGKYTLSRDETDQIGYRLAKELGLHAVYPVNVDGEFPVQRVSNYAKATGRAEKFDAIMAAAGARVKEQDEFLRSHTVFEMLEYINSDAMVAKDVAVYYASIPFGEPGDYAGSDLVALWYQRNIRIYHNIVALIDSPSDRILVIYGAGHLGWLQQDIANDATVKLRKLAELTGPR
ncbi:MAG TPA: DUF5694 domain-containing protein [Candidatus Dormibacteraeota bacterium]|nr:DUF5694 domain-containing protein [Candidatus Dormibacteraeota bacterium]